MYKQYVLLYILWVHKQNTKCIPKVVHCVRIIMYASWNEAGTSADHKITIQILGTVTIY